MMLPKKTSLVIATFGALLAVLELTKVARPFTIASMIDFQPRPPKFVDTPPAPLPKRVAGEKPVLPGPNLIDKDGSLTAFYQSLWRTESKLPGAVTRILHYGDSPVTADSITADARAFFQERFGDAGHGFVLIAKPWAWYGHRGVEISAHGWRIEAATQSHAHDGIHGLGGVSFEGGTGAESHIVLKKEHARMEVQYLSQPGGGVLAVKAEGQGIGTVETEGPAKQPGFQVFDLPAGAREIDLSVERGPVRMFGVSFEREQPGVIYNSLGLNGGQVQAVVRFFEKGQWTEQLQHQRPDLIVINYGTNESVYADYINHSYPGELREVIRRVQAAVPTASVLIMSPMDRGQRDSNWQITTVPSLPKLIEVQKNIAAEMHCAFFNTFQAMGGEGTMARWYESQPRLVTADFTHPFPAGARKVGVLLYEALESGFRHFQARMPVKAQPKIARRPIARGAVQ